jgi:hypothetical protein
MNSFSWLPTSWADSREASARAGKSAVVGTDLKVGHYKCEGRRLTL